MKKILCIVLPIVLCLSLFGCKKDENDLGKQTVIDKENGYTLVQEVLSFKFNNDEKELKKNSNAKFDGFNVTADKPMPMNTKKDAIAIAQKEIDFEYNKIKVFYDRTRGIWKVVFFIDSESEANGKTVTNSTEKGTVYVDEDGYTLAMAIV